MLKEHLNIIASNITSDLMLPKDGSPNNIAKIYSLLEAKVHINPAGILLKITVPLLYRDLFYLRHIIPVPFKQNESFKIITTQNHFIGVNKREERYYLMTHQQKSKCKSFSDNWIICDQANILYNTQQGSAKCEMAILTHLSKGISPKCSTARLKLQQVWSKLYTPNQFLFTVANDTVLNIICKERNEVCSINGSGIISLQQQCVIHTENMEIAAENVFSSDLPIIIAPNINITEWLQDHNRTSGNNFIKLNYHIDPELDALAVAIQEQRAAETVMPQFDFHHTHNYVFLYVGLAIGIAIIMWTLCKKRKSGNSNSMVLPMIMQSTQSQPISVSAPAIQQPVPAQRTGLPTPDEHAIYFP